MAHRARGRSMIKDLVSGCGFRERRADPRRSAITAGLPIGSPPPSEGYPVILRLEEELT